MPLSWSSANPYDLFQLLKLMLLQTWTKYPSAWEIAVVRVTQLLSDSQLLLYFASSIGKQGRSFSSKFISYVIMQIYYNQKKNMENYAEQNKNSCIKGGVSDVSLENIVDYFDFLKQKENKLSIVSSQNWLPSVKNFHALIVSDPILRMNWENGIKKCEKTLPGKTGNDVLGLINTACQTPPSFSNSDLVGFPINAIFVQFMQNENGRSFFSDHRVNNHLKEIFETYQKMLLSPASLEHMNDDSPDGWFCPQAKEKIDYNQYICFPQEPHYGFKNWNEWFLRVFKPGKRPVGAGSPNGINDDNIIVNSCESTPLTSPLQPQRDVKKTDNFWLKDNVYSLSDMFAADRFNRHHLVDHFVGGTVYQAFLSALFYHRWHAPVDGVIEDIYAIPGSYYLDQSQFIPYDEGSPNNSESFLSAVAARKVVVINSKNKHIGKVAIIYIGMAECSSCVSTVNVGEEVRKGQEIGHFEFGGSSHTMIFEKKANLLFNTVLYSKNSNGEVEGVKQNLSSFLAQVFPH